MSTSSDVRDQHLQVGRVSDPLFVGSSLASAPGCSWKSALFRNGGSTSAWTVSNRTTRRSSLRSKVDAIVGQLAGERSGRGCAAIDSSTDRSESGPYLGSSNLRSRRAPSNALASELLTSFVALSGSARI
jgi:hypothetical protein